MWKPNESLDDYTGEPTAGGSSVPPHPVSLQRTGAVKTLQPLTRLEASASDVPPVVRAFSRVRPAQPLWFRRVLAVGSAAIVLMALVLVSAILVGIDERASGPEVATNEATEQELTPAAETYSFDIFSPLNFVAKSDQAGILRTNVRRRSNRLSISLVDRKPRRQLRPVLQPTEPWFVPTTLVIYSENGEVKSRIEPWLRSS